MQSQIAKIITEETAKNWIEITIGANNCVDKKQINDNMEIIKGYDIILIQLEILLSNTSWINFIQWI